MQKIIFAVIGIISMLGLLPGCANQATARITPGADMSRVKSFYVVTQPDDKRGVGKLIQASLTKRGYATTIGPEKPAPYKADALVTYLDKWMWDITMYMIELTVVIRNPDNNFPLATGNSMHASLTRLSPEAMVEEVLGNIFKASKEAP